ncbi:MAG: branched-chain amino acid ABC transporter permease, partial [Mesorhizobium sp.]
GFPVTIATGLIFMVCVLIFRRGIVGEIYAKWLRRAEAGSNN